MVFMKKKQTDKYSFSISFSILIPLTSFLKVQQLKQSEMVKILRSGKILDETDEQLDIRENDTEIRHINKSQLKKIISSRLQKNRNQVKKKSRFIQRVISRTFFEVVDETRLECPVCLQLLINPMLRKCGHLYCYRCLQSTSVYNSRCSVCRQHQGDEPFINSRLAQTLIDKHVLLKNKDIYSYLCRTTDSTQWAKRRKINNLMVGLVVDFHNCLNIWTRGVILQVFQINKGKKMVQVKININGEDFAQTIEASSNRLAPYAFFTRKRYLQEFSPILPEIQVGGDQLSCLEYEQRQDEDQFFRFQENNAVYAELQQNLDYFERVDNAYPELDYALNLLDSQNLLILS